MGNELWSPLEIETMMRVHCSGDGVVLYPTHDSHAHLAARTRLIDSGLIKSTGDTREQRLYVTDLGKAFVSLICQTPIPVIRYVDPRTEKQP